MKVVAKRTVLGRILEDVAKLKTADRLVDYVVVTPEEFKELREDYRTDRYVESSMYRHMSAKPADATATMKVWDFPRTTPPVTSSDHWRGHHHIRVCDRGETFMGFPLLVVPAEFHPK